MVKNPVSLSESISFVQDIYQGRLQEIQRDALIGHLASQRGEVVDGATAMAQIRANLRSRYGE